VPLFLSQGREEAPGATGGGSGSGKSIVTIENLVAGIANQCCVEMFRGTAPQRLQQDREVGTQAALRDLVQARRQVVHAESKRAVCL
jgi:hypothetical protein